MKYFFLLIFFLLLYVSVDATWFKVNHPDKSKITAFGNRGDTLFTIQNNKIIYKTSNYGDNWETIVFKEKNYNGLQITRNGNIVISISPMGLIVEVSTNFGKSFIQKAFGSQSFWGAGIGYLNSRYITGRAEGDLEYYLGISKDGTNFNHIYGRDIKYIHDKVGDFIAFGNPNVIITKFKDTLVRSEDLGKTWTALKNPGIKNIGLCEENSKSKLFMCLNDTIFTSDDLGLHWYKLNSDINFSKISIISIDNSDNLYIKSNDKFFTSSDDGLNWKDITENLELSVNINPVIRFSDSKIYLRGADSNIYYRDIVTTVQDENKINDVLSIYPNPARDNVSLYYIIGTQPDIRLSLYDNLGNELKLFNEEFKSQGMYTIDINTSGLVSGIYYVKLVSSKRSTTLPLIINK
ncbi:MAG: Subtilisin-like serine protease [Ignavibacteria bacterium]|nr:Subtilisin-like serine protease [Ignavibacteria bacterium]